MATYIGLSISGLFAKLGFEFFINFAALIGEK
jgi:hypothetical protein